MILHLIILDRDPPLASRCESANIFSGIVLSGKSVGFFDEDFCCRRQIALWIPYCRHPQLDRLVVVANGNHLLADSSQPHGGWQNGDPLPDLDERQQRLGTVAFEQDLWIYVGDLAGRVEKLAR